MQADRFAVALSSFTRATLVTPVDAVGSFVGFLTEDATREGLDAYLGDLDRMRAASDRLAAMIRGLLEGGGAKPGSPEEVEQASSRLRHDLRTPIAAILGYAELIEEDALEASRTAFCEILRSLIAALRRLLAQVDELVVVLRAGAPAAETERGGKTVEAIRSVLVPSSTPVEMLTGQILVVDDDVTNLDLLRRRLIRDGHAVEAAASGEEALARLRATPADLILMDLIMPGLTGIDVLRRLRSEPETRLTPVLIISGLEESEGSIRCIEAGADDYLSKPIDTVLLRARIQASLERKRLRDREVAMMREIQIERERSEALLRNVLPGPVVDRLQAGEGVIADHFDSATILFCDIVGFTGVAGRLPPGQTLDLLNAIFSGFDRLATEAGVEKIKTIGDSYMVAGGLPQVREGHAAAVVGFALRMPGVVAEASRPLGLTLAVRIGIDTGPVAAGVIGASRLVYDVWGDTVNTASRMESQGVPGRVHVTEATRAALAGRYPTEALAPVDVKGKGLMQTYLVEQEPTGLR